MDVLDSVRQKVRDTALTALKASSDFIEVSKINMAISTEETRIKALMLELGKSIYEEYKSGQALNEELEARCKGIVNAEKNIEDMKQKILDIKSMRTCAGCSSEIERSAAYCPNCGKKVEVIEKDEEMTEMTETTENEDSEKEE